MTALDEEIAAIALVEPLRGREESLGSKDGFTQKNFRFREVGGDDTGEREEFCFQTLQSFVREQQISRTGAEDGINDERKFRMLSHKTGDHSNEIGCGEHSCFYGK